MLLFRSGNKNSAKISHNQEKHAKISQLNYNYLIMKDIDILKSVYNYLFETDKVKNQKEFASIIGETNTGWFDLKLERKKVTINHLRAIALKFEELNRNFIFLGEGVLTSELNDNPLIDDYINNLIENNKLLKEKVRILESELKGYKN